MKVLLQRVSRASVSTNGRIEGKIGTGLLALAGFGKSDTEEDLEWMETKMEEIQNLIRFLPCIKFDGTEEEAKMIINKFRREG